MDDRFLTLNIRPSKINQDRKRVLARFETVMTHDNHHGGLGHGHGHEQTRLRGGEAVVAAKAGDLGGDEGSELGPMWVSAQMMKRGASRSSDGRTARAAEDGNCETPGAVGSPK